MKWSHRSLPTPGVSFLRRRKGGMVIIDRGMVYAKIFYGEIASPVQCRNPEPPNRGGAQKGGPVNSQYVVLFTQRMIKVPQISRF